MALSSGVRIFLILLGALLIGFVLLPNLFNQPEEDAFGEEKRVSRARARLKVSELGDSATLVPGEFFRKGSAYQAVFGQLNRELWGQGVKAAVLRANSLKGGLDTLEFSGSQQTIGIDMVDPQGRVWAVRSVKKDQVNALPSFLRPSLLRPLIRDQAAALNPYAALVLPTLAEEINLHHTNPALYIFPYDPGLGRFNRRMAGRLVMLEEEADESWAGEPAFGQALTLLDTEDMLDTLATTGWAIDTLLYARSRLFDILISDWDRHEGNWQWALVEENGSFKFEPVPVDRDAAFYNYTGGAFTQAFLMLNDKFQSFTPEIKEVEGLMQQSEELDRAILKNISQEALLEQADYIQQQLSEEVIQQAFRQYPPEIYRMVGRKHAQILQSRLEQLPAAAKRFHALLSGE